MAHPVGPWHDQTVVLRPCGDDWAGGTPAPPHPVCVVGRGGVLWRCRACGDGSPSLWLHHHKRGGSAPLQRPRLGSSPHRPHPVPTRASQGVSVATSAHPVPRHRHPPTVDTKNRRPAPLSGHQMHRFVRDRGASTTHTDPARRVAAAPCFWCGYAVLEGGRSRAKLDTIDTLDMVVREWTERTRQRENIFTTTSPPFSPYRPCPLSSFSFDHVESVHRVFHYAKSWAQSCVFVPRHWCPKPCRLCLSCPTPLERHTPSDRGRGAHTTPVETQYGDEQNAEPKHIPKQRFDERQGRH